jgi:ribosomal protein S18 acetylase RimI-like enzyme
MCVKASKQCVTYSHDTAGKRGKTLSFEIVNFNQDYQKALIELWKECSLIVPQNDPIEDIQKKLEFQPDLFFIALLDGKLVGSVMAGYEGHRGWLNYLAVLPDFQKRGYGRELVKRAIAELERLGCLKLNVQIRESNISAVRFYERLGFRDDHVVSLGLRLERRSNPTSE